LASHNIGRYDSSIILILFNLFPNRLMSTTVSQALALARYLPPSLHGSAALSHLTNEQRAELHDWAESQPSQPGQSVNLLDWPGWTGIKSKQVEHAAGARLAEEGELAPV
jgi:hypothetical protein